MDTNIQSIGSVSGIVSVISIVIYGVYKCFQHFHFVSKCCGNEISLDVDLGEKQIKDESVYLKLKNFIPHRRQQSSLPSLNEKVSSLPSPPPPPPSPLPSSLASLPSLEQLEHHVRF